MNPVTLFTMPTSVGEWTYFVVVLVLMLGFAGVAIYTTIKLIKNGDFEKIEEAATEAIKQAEATHKTGAEKKAIAMAAVKAYCESIGMKWTAKVLNFASKWIDKYILDHNELKKIEDDKEV